MGVADEVDEELRDEHLNRSQATDDRLSLRDLTWKNEMQQKPVPNTRATAAFKFDETASRSRSQARSSEAAALSAVC